MIISSKQMSYKSLVIVTSSLDLDASNNRQMVIVMHLVDEKMVVF